ncbi:MAG: transketolase-like TK C-terminal-containing protein, partial [Betaproteobacteria bacterium]
AGQGKMTTHSQKKFDEQDLIEYRNRFDLPLSDEQAKGLAFYKPADDSAEMRYLREHRERLGGSLPKRETSCDRLPVPALASYGQFALQADGKEMSTTMAFVRMLGNLLKDTQLGPRIVPIVADEARTFGMANLFKQVGIYSSVGQRYAPEDIGSVLSYREALDGQILEEGISEAGAIASWTAAATSYSVHRLAMLPFYIYYSMFGFQRVGDLAWAAADQRARGFLLGGTAGRTTLNGEGLQHEDGHSHLAASTIPNCIAYDPTFSYEVAVIIQDGLRRMVAEQEDVFYYLTVMNENYTHPAMPAGAEAGILKGMYLFSAAEGGRKTPRVQLLGSGAILREVIAAADLLKTDFGVAADVWSCPSFNELRRDGMATDRWNLLHPEAKPRSAYVTQSLEGHGGPVVAATDYMRIFAEQIRPWVPRRYTVLGTDGFGRSDTREKLRRFFEVNRHYVAVAALRSLADEGAIPAATVSQAIAKYGIDPDRPAPWTV